MALPERQTDVVVVGSGMGGLVSALRALEHGGDVILLEKGDRPGGTTRVTGGYIAFDEEADPNIAPFEPVEEGLAWLRDRGVEVEELDRWEHGESVTSQIRIDPPQFVERMTELIEQEGGELLLETPFEELTTDEQGDITGVLAYNQEEGRFRINAPSVILAAGGRSGNEQIVTDYYPNADLLLGRDPWSTGDGYLAAKDVGGKATGLMRSAIGVSRPAPPAEISFEEMRCGQIYDTSSVALTTEGRRFTDETDTASQSDGFIQNYLERVEGEVFLVIDQEVYENTDRYQSHVSDRLELARELGGVVLEANTLEDLCSQLSEHGVDGEQALDTLSEFNVAVSSESDMTLDPPRENYRDPLDTPPFYAVKVIPAILYFVGGLDVDEHSRVINRARSTSSMEYRAETDGELVKEPIHGLYATGVEVGKSSEDGYYGGGLSLGLVTGRVAGKHAAQRATETPVQNI